jgi:superfamily II DNA helicase RecQ
VIFHDSTLTEVAHRRPASLALLAAVPGIARRKPERYGNAILAIVAKQGRAGQEAPELDHGAGGSPL